MLFTYVIYIILLCVGFTHIMGQEGRYAYYYLVIISMKNITMVLSVHIEH